MRDDSVDNAFFHFSFPQQETQGYSLVVDSPHSGRDYPADFNYTCDFSQLRRLEDAYVDLFCDGLDSLGASVLTSKIPRSYIDTSRARDCLDPVSIPGGLSELPYDTTGNNERSLKAQTGLIFLQSKINNFRIYDKGSEPNEQAIKTRLNAWDAYHTQLSSVFNAAHDEKKTVYHIDLHSCWRLGVKDKSGERMRRPDVIIHDKFGRSCTSDFTQTVLSVFKDEGFDAQLNVAPFKGGYIVTNYGRPENNLNSIQIEFVRDLYMNESTLELHEGVKRIQDTMKKLTQSVIEFANLKHNIVPEEYTL